MTVKAFSALGGFVLAALALSTPMRASIPGSTPVIRGTKPAIWVFAHPDDETLAAAGAIHEHEEAGRRNIVIIVDGGTSAGPCIDDGFSDATCVAARRIESRLAIASLGVALRDVRHLGWNYDNPGWTSADLVVHLDAFIANSLGLTASQVSLKGHSPNDHYAPWGLGGHRAHREVASALRTMNTRASNRLTDVRYYRIGHLFGDFTCGTPGEGRARYLTSHWHAVKQVAAAEYKLYSPAAGRYAIGGRSVADEWNEVANTNTPECWERPEDL